MSGYPRVAPSASVALTPSWTVYRCQLPLGQVATWTPETVGTLTNPVGEPLTAWDMIPD